MNGFANTLRAEWTKFRTVRGWVLATVAAAGLIVALGVMPGMEGTCGRHGPGSGCELPLGPGGEEVTDSFTFLHQALAGDGSITVRVTGMTGILPGGGPNGRDDRGDPNSGNGTGDPGSPSGRGGADGPRHGVAPWAKAGLIVRADTGQGSTYAAVMMTGAHGARMQYDYTHDLAGGPDAATADHPRWLRLSRAGDTVTGSESADGVRWVTIGTARLPGLPATAQVGLFVTSPQYTEAVHAGLASGAMGGPSQATGTFDHLSTGDGWTGTAWQPDVIGAAGDPGGAGDPGDGPTSGAEGFERDGDTLRLRGSGDIAPAVAGAAGLGVSISQTLVGTFVGLIVAVVVGCVFVTAEYRRGLLRTTFLASPGRGRVLAAKAAVVSGAMFVTGLAAAAAVVTLGQRVLRGNGVYVHPVPMLTELRVVAGTAALLALAAILALGLGTLLRRGVTAITAAVVLVVLPYLLAVTILPVDAARWLLRVTPAAGFALQQSAPEYPQVANLYTPADGYFPLAPWAGLAVLAGWAVVALAVAAVALRWRDA
ncbi:ABC-2 family transporter protein [Parafrankia irregularis]|uniref:ABC-2 family transporter protein n=1 Tax=Parafrankia irregularis TaxID=795642 RepID=A0A0S4QUN7_9ACTN|nr:MULTISPECIES: hypothetical protein [Parafrankia]MBE3205884.1 hypothetical protein [Parafrankia sp. CH37]CUU58170.1 ABC-2 family transporter protein [Parafrankia irregularis]